MPTGVRISVVYFSAETESDHRPRKGGEESKLSLEEI